MSVIAPETSPTDITTHKLHPDSDLCFDIPTAAISPELKLLFSTRTQLEAPHGWIDEHTLRRGVEAVRICDYNQYCLTENKPRANRYFIQAMVLAYLETKNTLTSPEQIGRAYDTFLLVVRALSPFVKDLNSKELEILALFMETNNNLSMPGLSKETRENMSMLSIGLLACNTLSIRTLTNHDYYDLRNKVPYPTQEADSIITNPVLIPEDIFQLTQALSSPFIASLGESSLGHTNLLEMTETIPRLFPKLDAIPDSLPIKGLAQFSLLIRLFHLGENIDPQLISSCLPTAQKQFKRYCEHRAVQPQWADKLEIYGTYPPELSKIIESHDRQSDNPIFIGLSLRMSQLVSLLSTGGPYLSLYEAFDGNGHPTIPGRSGYETSHHLQASGTPDDPYIRYGALHSPQDYQPVHYGNWTLVLKSECLDRTSVTLQDSFEADYLPLNGSELLIKSRQHYHKLAPPYCDYAEAQIHGSVSLDDVHFIVFDDNDIDPNSLEVAKITRVAAKYNLDVKPLSDLKK